MALQHVNTDVSNGIPSNLSRKETGDGDLVGCAQPCGRGPPGASGLVCEVEAAERRPIGWFEVEPRQRRPVDGAERRRDAIRIAERVPDREMHRRHRQLCDASTRRRTRPSSARPTAGARPRRSGRRACRTARGLRSPRGPCSSGCCESTVIFGPIAQVGCASADSTVTVGQLVGGLARGTVHRSRSAADGSPRGRGRTTTAGTDAMRSVRCRPARFRHRASIAAAGRPGPAAIRLSLLASAKRLPACNVSTVTVSPAKPTTPLTTTSATSTMSAESVVTCDAGSSRGDARVAPPDRRSRPPRVGTPRSERARRRRRDRRAQAPSPRTTPGSRAFSARMTSIVCVPIDPVDPAIATRTVIEP